MKQNTGAQNEKLFSVPQKYYHAEDKRATHNNSRNNHFKKIRTKLKTVAGTVATLAGTAGFLLLASSFSIGYTVKVDDTVVGTVATKSEYYEVLDEVKSEVKTIANVEFEPAGEESFHVELVKKEDFTQKEELAENIKSMSDEMVQAASITYDGEFYAALPTEDETNNILNKYLLNFTQDNENIAAEFARAVEVTTTHVLADSIQTADDFYNTLLAGKVLYHVVAEGETLESVAAMYNVTTNELTKENSLAADEDLTGKTLTIHTNEPLFSVKTVEHINGNVEIPFQTTSEEDASLYEGRKKIVTQGKNGLKYVDAYITKVDGVTVSEDILEENILTQPVTQVEKIGTKEAPPSVGTGDFAMPTSGTLSSPFGPRWGRMHTGIDLRASTGTPIYASDNGIVREAQYKNNGYGNLIIVDHGNGFVTYYAHCSEISVSAGDVVAKGDLIGAVGNTGRSTGPHLHFEIREDGTAKDPMPYLK